MDVEDVDRSNISVLWGHSIQCVTMTCSVVLCFSREISEYAQEAAD